VDRDSPRRHTRRSCQILREEDSTVQMTGYAAVGGPGLTTSAAGQRSQQGSPKA
jgi:hypothetical protein